MGLKQNLSNQKSFSRTPMQTFKANLNIFSRSKKAPHIVIVLKTNPGRAT
jgi:hypothetical protein